MNTISTLEGVSRNPEKLLATGIAQTVEALGSDTPHLRERVLGLIKGKIVLTPLELTLILDALTSQQGGAVMDLVNHRLFCNFMNEKDSREKELSELVSSGMDEFLSGGTEKKDDLLAMSQMMREFAQAKKGEPGNISAPEIWKYIE